MTSYCTTLVRKGNIAVPCGQVLIGGVCPVHGVLPERNDMTPPMASDHNKTVDELELRYLAWTALKGWDAMSLRKAQRSGPTAAAMEAMRAVLPADDAR